MPWEVDLDDPFAGNLNHSPSNLDPNNFRGQECKQIFNDLHSRLLQQRVDSAIELPIDLKPGDLMMLNEIISPMVAVPSNDAIREHKFSMHPIPFSCTYICEEYLNKWVTDSPPAQIGGNMFSERRNLDQHQTCMMMDGREDYRVKKAILSTEDFSARMNNYLHNSCCVLGAQGCRRKEERLACNNVLFWLDMKGLFSLFHNKSVQMMMAAMVFPQGLSEGKDTYDARNGVNFTVNGKNALMSFVNDDSLPYLQNLKTWQEYLKSGVKDGHKYNMNFNLVFEHVKKVGIMHIVLITKTSRKLTIHRHLQERTDCIKMYNWIPLMGDLAKKLGITWFNRWAISPKRMMRALENCKVFYVPRVIAGEIDAFLFNRKDDTIDRQSAGVMLGSKLYRIIIGTQVVQQGYSMCLQDFCDLSILFLLRSFIARTRATGVVGFASNNIMKRGNLLGFFSSMFELIFAPSLDAQHCIATLIRFKRFANAVMKTSMSHELLRQVILQSERPMAEVFREFAKEHSVQDIYVPPVKDITYNPNTTAENLPGQCFNMVVAKLGAKSSLPPFSTQAECEEELERLKLQDKGVMFVDNHALLQTTSGEFCKHFTSKSVHYTDDKGRVYDLTERCDRKWLDGREKHNVCKTTRALGILGLHKEEVTNLCAMPANDEVVWQEYKGVVHHHLDSRYFQNRIIPDYPKKQDMCMDTNIFCKECLQHVTGDAIFADLGADLPEEHLSMFYCIAMKQLRSTGVKKICLKVMNFRYIMESGNNKNFLEELFAYWHVVDAQELQANEVYVINFRYEKAIIFDQYTPDVEEWIPPFDGGFEEGTGECVYPDKPDRQPKVFNIAKRLQEFMYPYNDWELNRRNFAALPGDGVCDWVQPPRWMQQTGSPSAPSAADVRHLMTDEIPVNGQVTHPSTKLMARDDYQEAVMRFAEMMDSLPDYSSDGESSPVDAKSLEQAIISTEKWQVQEQEKLLWAQIAADKKLKKLKKRTTLDEWHAMQMSKAQKTSSDEVDPDVVRVMSEKVTDPAKGAISKVKIEHTEALTPVQSGSTTPVDWATEPDQSYNAEYPYLQQCLEYPEFWGVPFDGTAESLPAAQEAMLKKTGGIFELECTLEEPQSLMSLENSEATYFKRSDAAFLLARYGRDTLKTKKQYIDSPVKEEYAHIPFWGYIDKVDGDKIIGAVKEAPKVEFHEATVDFSGLKKHKPQITLAKDLADTREEKFKDLHKQARQNVMNWKPEGTKIQIGLMEGTYGSGKSYYLRRHVDENVCKEKGDENYIIVCPTGALAREYREKKYKALTWSVAMASYDHWDDIEYIYLDELFLMDPRVVYYFCDLGKKVFAVGDRKQMRPDIPVSKLFDVGSNVTAVPRLNVTRSTPVDCVTLLNKREEEPTFTMSKIFNSIRLRKVNKLDDAEGCRKNCNIEHDHTPLFVFDKHRSQHHKISTIASIQGLRQPVVSLMMTPTAKMLIDKVQGQFLVACSRHTKRLNIYYTDVTARMVDTYFGVGKRSRIGDKSIVTRDPIGPNGSGFKLNRIGARDDYCTTHGNAEFIKVRYNEGEGKLFKTSYEGKLAKDKRANLEKLIEQAAGDLEITHPSNYPVNAARHGAGCLGVDLVECEEMEYPRIHDPLNDDLEEKRDMQRLFTSHQTFPADASNIVSEACPTSSQIAESRRTVNITKHRAMKPGKVLSLKMAEALSHREDRTTIVQMSRLFAANQTNSANHRLATAVERYGQHRKEELSATEKAQKLYDLQKGFMKFVEIENLRAPNLEELEICRAQALLRAAAKKNQKETGEWGAVWNTTEQIKCFNKEQLKCKVGDESWLNVKSVETADANELVYIKGGQMVSAQAKEVNQVASPHVNWAERIVMASTKQNVLFGYGHSPRSLKKKIQRILRDQDHHYQACSTDISEQDTTKDEVTDAFMRWIYESCGVPEVVINAMEKPNQHWIMNNLACKVKVKYQFQSGRADTLFANTCHLMGVIGSSFDFENLRIALFQGDDCYIRADSLELRDDAFKNLKVDENPVGDFVGFIIGHDSLYLDIVRMAAKTLSRTIGDEGRREELRQAVQDGLAVNKTLLEKRQNIVYSGAKTKLDTGSIGLLYDYLEGYASPNEADVVNYRVQKKLKETCMHLVSQVLVVQDF